MTDREYADFLRLCANDAGPSRQQQAVRAVILLVCGPLYAGDGDSAFELLNTLVPVAEKQLAQARKRMAEIVVGGTEAILEDEIPVLSVGAAEREYALYLAEDAEKDPKVAELIENGGKQ